MSSDLDRLAEEAPNFVRSSEFLEQALEFARQAHQGQERQDPGSPFVVHPILVAERLAAHGYDEDVIAAALLHDVLERSDVGVRDIADRFGWAVANLVVKLSDDPRLDEFVEAKDAHRLSLSSASREALAIFAADRISNAREMARLVRVRGEAAADGDKTDLRTRLRLWQQDVLMLERRAPDLDLLPEMRTAVGDYALAVAALRQRPAETPV